MNYIIGNWKSHKNLADVKGWINTFSASQLASTPTLNIIVCPSFVHLPTVHQLFPSINLGVQTLSPYPDGAYTGAVSARMASEYAQYALLGHVERRKYFHETDAMVAQQAIQAVENQLTPILAVDKNNWSSQLAQLTDEQLKQSLVMYEPAEAISTSGGGAAADLGEVLQAIQLITTEYSVKGVLYGGSVTAENIAHYMNEPSIAGVVPGAASLDASSFVQLIKAARV
jgi:triosephosphate isomerase